MQKNQTQKNDSRLRPRTETHYTMASASASHPHHDSKARAMHKPKAVAILERISAQDNEVEFMKAFFKRLQDTNRQAMK